MGARLDCPGTGLGQGHPDLWCGPDEWDEDVLALTEEEVLSCKTPQMSEKELWFTSSLTA